MPAPDRPGVVAPSGSHPGGEGHHDPDDMAGAAGAGAAGSATSGQSAGGSAVASAASAAREV
jgi:hypothetical protein